MPQDNNALAQELEARAVISKLVMCARTSWGTAGPDQGLIEACEDGEMWLAKYPRTPAPASGEVADIIKRIRQPPVFAYPAEDQRLRLVAEEAADMLERLGGASPEEHFLTAHVSEDGSVVGIDHSMNADWHAVRTAHIALRDRINERLETEDNCPFKPTQQPGDQEIKDGK